MDIQNDSTPNHSNSNLPTSLDVTQLLSKLSSVQNSSQNHNNIRLIELDPYYHDEHEPSQSQSQSRRNKTRLFLAVAFGSQVAAAQLFALELEKVGDATGDDIEDYEWVDVSDERVHTGQGSRTNIPVVVFPPSCADLLPTCHAPNQNVFNHEKYHEAMKGVEITSCALIPSPVMRVASNDSTGETVDEACQETILTQCISAVVIGTSRGQVFSLLLRVTKSSRDASTSNDNCPFFMLNYGECKRGENEKMGKHAQLDSHVPIPKQPALHQVLPRAKLYNPGDCIDALDEDFSFLDGDVEAQVQVIHPSLSTQTQKCVGDKHVSSISFGRGDWKLCRNTKKTRGLSVLLNQDSVWVTYAHGTIVRMPSWKLFFSLDSSELLNDETKGEGDSAAGNPAQKVSVVPVNNPFPSPLDIPPPKWKCLKPSGYCNPEADFDEQSIASKMSIGTNYSQYTVTNEQNYWNLLSTAVSQSTLQAHGVTEHASNTQIQALVIESQSALGATLPFTFQSSQMECAPLSTSLKMDNSKEAYRGANANHDKDDFSWASSSSEDERYGPVTGKVVGGTAALVRGALGAALGAVRWGFGGGAGVDDSELIDDEDGKEMHVDDSLDIERSVGQSQMNAHDHNVDSNCGPRSPVMGKGQKVDLLPWPLSNTSLLFSDVPRRVENAVVDPSSTLVATTDNLGRVLLIDLETQQPIRMWKGMRNVSCHYAEVPYDYDFGAGKLARTKLYLVIHAHKRGTLEVYRLRQGPRVAVAAVPQQKGCFVLECLGPPSEGSRVSSFLFEETTAEGQAGCSDRQCILDYIVIDDNDCSRGRRLPQKVLHSSSQIENSSMQLDFLVQLLAPDTNIQCNARTILNTFQSIRALSDLGEGLDVISKSHKIEQMGIEASKFHSQALSHCKNRLENALEKEIKEGSGLIQKSVISSLSSKISYHEKLIRAYDVLHHYEVRNDKDYNGESDADFRDAQPLSEWASEAISWISAAEEHGTFTSSLSVTKQREDLKKPLPFSKFAMACSPPNMKTGGLQSPTGVYLTEVKRDRQPILMRIFHPLLFDLFVFKVVNSIFNNLGINENFDIQQQYFGEWVLTLASYDIAQSNFSGAWRPMPRWLQDLILSAYDVHQRSPDFDNIQLKRVVQLQSLLDFCSDMEDLTKAFVLAVICMDAVFVASKQIEEKTYGTISQVECVRPWEILLRKLRVLLLVVLRLSGDVNPMGTGTTPMTVRNVSAGGLFSTYYWVARDELSLSHDNQVLIALESACLSSSVAFYPSSPDGDTISNKKAILQSCSYTKKTSLSNSRPLLFYLRDHATFTTHLAAHRALILGRLWGQTPDNLLLLNNAISTLQVVLDRFEDFSLATIVEFYQSLIRPLCRAIIFGFHEIHEHHLSYLMTVIDDEVWRHNFSSAAKRVLSLLIKCTNKHKFDKKNSFSPSLKGDVFNIAEMWPGLRIDPFLAALADKFKKVHITSIELHHTILFAYELTGSVTSLESIAPTVHDLFTAGALFSDMPCTEGSPQQYQLLDTLLVEHAKKTVSPVVDRFDLYDIEVVGKSMGIDTKYVRTRYFLEMIRFGMDASIDDLLASNIAYLDKRLFLDEIVQIICERLYCTISSLKKTKSYRGVVSVLDADASRWIREEAKKGPSSQNNRGPISLISTNNLVLRIQSMSKSVEDDILDKKISAISTMIGTLLKAVQAREHQVMNV